jgi:sRNA-binding protein
MKKDSKVNRQQLQKLVSAHTQHCEQEQQQQQQQQQQQSTKSSPPSTPPRQTQQSVTVASSVSPLDCKSVSDLRDLYVKLCVKVQRLHKNKENTENRLIPNLKDKIPGRLQAHGGLVVVVGAQYGWLQNWNPR